MRGSRCSDPNEFGEFLASLPEMVPIDRGKAIKEYNSGKTLEQISEWTSFHYSVTGTMLLKVP